MGVTPIDGVAGALPSCEAWRRPLLARQRASSWEARRPLEECKGLFSGSTDTGQAQAWVAFRKVLVAVDNNVAQRFASHVPAHLFGDQPPGAVVQLPHRAGHVRGDERPRR